MKISTNFGSRPPAVHVELTWNQLREAPDGVYKPASCELCKEVRLVVTRNSDRADSPYILYVGEQALEPAAVTSWENNTFVRADEGLELRFTKQ